MALVKCNHCGKETKNDTQKCRWCNKELDKNLENIAREINSTVKKEPLEEKENLNWICDECNEENELNFDTCWNCQTVSEKDSKKAADIQIELTENAAKQEKEEDEINALEEKIYNSLRYYRLITFPLALIIALIFCTFILYYFGSLWQSLDFLILPSSLFIGFIVSEYIQSKFFRKKVIQKLGLDKHRYYNQISVFSDIKSNIMYLGIICVIIGVLMWGSRALNNPL